MTPPEQNNAPESSSGNAHITSGLKRRWLLNAGLLALVAALAWFLFDRSDKNENILPPALTNLSAAAVSHVRIEHPEKPDIVIEKTESKWKLTAPLAARANSSAVENLLRLLSAPAETRFPVVTAELARYGLDKPAARVHLENEAIAFGALHPLKNQIYVLHNNEVALIPGQHLSAATYSYTIFLDTRLFEEERKLTRIKLPDFTLELKNGAWQKQPSDTKLTSDRINDFASEWKNARALSVEKYSGKETLDEIEISSTRDEKNEKLILGIIGYKPDFILYRPDENLEYHLTEATGKRLLGISPE